MAIIEIVLTYYKFTYHPLTYTLGLEILVEFMYVCITNDIAYG